MTVRQVGWQEYTVMENIASGSNGAGSSVQNSRFAATSLSAAGDLNVMPRITLGGAVPS